MKAEEIEFRKNCHNFKKRLENFDKLYDEIGKVQSMLFSDAKLLGLSVDFGSPDWGRECKIEKL